MDTTEKKTPVGATGPAVTRVDLALVFSAGEVVTPPLRFRPGREALVIGRETSRGLALPTDPRASRRHASVFGGPDGSLHLVDESSTNGTWVNGGRVDEAELVEGDVITVGDSLLVVSAEPEGPSEAERLELVGSSEALRRLRSRLAHAAPGNAPLLLLGDTGCGEETAARALHALSGRQGPFIAVNCGARPEGLTEAQLFGHESDSFGTARRGLFGDAEGGTLFLNEIGELNPALQSKLLRALRERLTMPVGAVAPRPCDVRVVAATDRALVGNGRAFLGELYTHLTERTLHIPPLRERREDVLALLAHALGTPSPKLEVELAERLLLYDWPYNIRELRSLAKQLLIRSGEGPYELDPVEGQLTPRPRRVAKERPPADLPTLPAIPALRVLAARETLPPRTSPPRESPSDRGTTARYGFITAEFPAIVATELPPVVTAELPPVVTAELSADAPPESTGAKGRDPPPGRAQLEALLRRHSGVVSEVARAVSRSRKQVYRWLEHHGLDAEAFRRLAPLLPG